MEQQLTTLEHPKPDGGSAGPSKRHSPARHLTGTTDDGHVDGAMSSVDELRASMHGEGAVFVARGHPFAVTSSALARFPESFLARLVTMTKEDAREDGQVMQPACEVPVIQIDRDPALFVHVMEVRNPPPSPSPVKPVQAVHRTCTTGVPLLQATPFNSMSPVKRVHLAASGLSTRVSLPCLSLVHLLSTPPRRGPWQMYDTPSTLPTPVAPDTAAQLWRELDFFRLLPSTHAQDPTPPLPTLLPAAVFTSESARQQEARELLFEVRSECRWRFTS